MCPDLDILSTYYDDEIESSHKNEIKKHVDSCSKCQKTMAEFGKLSDILHIEEEPDFDMAQSRVWNNVMDKIESEESVPDFWHRKILLSVPAAAALAAVFIAVFSMSFLSYFIGKNSSASPASPELNITDASGYNYSMDNIFDDKSIDFDIPVVDNFIHVGEPLLIREVDFQSQNGRY